MSSPVLRSPDASGCHIFDITKFSQAVRGARAALELSQIDLAKRAALQVNTIRQVESAATDSGILTCLAIARALDLNLPPTQIDEQVESFACNLFKEPKLASEDFDERFYHIADFERPRGVPLPKNLLWLTALKGREFFLFSVTLKCKYPHTKQSLGELYGDDMLPLECALLVESMASEIKKCNPELAVENRAHLQVAQFWKHVATGRSDNVGASRLGHDLTRAQASLSIWKEGKYDQESLHQLALRAFNNHFELKAIMRKAALDAQVEFSDDYMVYLASFLRLYKTARKLDEISGTLNEELGKLSS